MHFICEAQPSTKTDPCGERKFRLKSRLAGITALPPIVIPFFILAVLLPVLAEEGTSERALKPFVRYSEYGAVGDGVADDLDAIVKTHNAANEAGLAVQADAGATYYIGGANKTARILTDTDWGDARFMIDDTKVENRGSQIFVVSSRLPAIPITTIEKLKKNQGRINLTLPQDSFVSVTDKTTKRYIRLGLNQNKGTDQADVFVVDQNGKVDAKTPILWDFDNITSMTAYPLDSETLTVCGGKFTTIANQAESKYTYYARGINVARSNTILDGIRHEITGELNHGAPYGGFLTVSNCANITIRNCILSGHKTYETIGSAGKPVSMGSYDISVNRSVNVTFHNCKQTNDIHDTKLWGIFGSNFSKNIVFDNVAFSRFDAHMGVANATIRNSILGHQGINLIGSGVFRLENTKVHSRNFINLRSDYGSTFEGNIIIKNCEYVPMGNAKSDAILIAGGNSGQHNFGYVCHMPRKITIDGLIIHDINKSDDYRGPKIFAVFNNGFKNDQYVEKFPYTITKEVRIRKLAIKSGKPWLISSNPFLFRNVKVTEH